MSQLPDIIGSGNASPVTLTPLQAGVAARAQRKTEVALYKHGLDARFRAECDRMDTFAVADAARTALEEELSLLECGLSRAKGSGAAIELVARKVELLSAIDNSRIRRTFGR